MTGYAVTFNIRHKRSGHLFQNRYKSVVCEEDAYLLELIRYIHLNPLRASLVQNLQELDKYPWSGHSAILGRRKNPLLPDPPKELSALSTMPSAADRPLAESTIEDILLHFGETKRVAIKRYREFVEKGIKQGTREDLQGGGLVRSAGGETAGLLGRKAEERDLPDSPEAPDGGRGKGDARILGSGDFVDATLSESEKLLERKYGHKKAIEDLIKDVSEAFGVSPELICSGSRKPRISDARAIVAHMAVEETGHAATDVARHLGIRQTSVLQSVKKGKILCGRVATGVNW